MKRIFSQIKTRIDAIESHPLFRDVHTLEAEQIPSMMKVWAPMFIHLSMTFRGCQSDVLCLLAAARCL